MLKNATHETEPTINIWTGQEHIAYISNEGLKLTGTILAGIEKNHTKITLCD